MMACYLPTATARTSACFAHRTQLTTCPVDVDVRGQPRFGERWILASLQAKKNWRFVHSVEAAWKHTG